MFKIQTLNKISRIGLEGFDRSRYTWDNEQDNPDAVLVRSSSMHEMELGSNLKAIARAGAGVNNIPLDKCTEKGIVVFNTPGANANAVKELVLLSLLISSRKVVPAIEWVKNLKCEDSEIPNLSNLIEKEKSKFGGPEIFGKKLGVVGLGAIGVLVCNAAVDLGMDVYGYDPYISVDGAWRLSGAVKHANSLKEIFSVSDYITLHVPSTGETKGMIDADSIADMKNGVRIINLSRGDLVSTEDIISAMDSGKVSCYVTDFPAEKMLAHERVIPMPHLGASTPESEENCAVMAVAQIRDFFENGNIVNSVNFPGASLPRSGDVRICVINVNVPAMVTNMSRVISDFNVNIENMVNKSNKEYAYTIFDISGPYSDDIIKRLSSVDGVLKAWSVY